MPGRDEKERSGIDVCVGTDTTALLLGLQVGGDRRLQVGAKWIVSVERLVHALEESRVEMDKVSELHRRARQHTLAEVGQKACDGPFAGSRGELFAMAGKRLEAIDDQGRQELVAICEIVVQNPRGDTGLARDATHGDTRRSVMFEDLFGRVQQRSASSRVRDTSR